MGGGASREPGQKTRQRPSSLSSRVQRVIASKFGVADSDDSDDDEEERRKVREQKHATVQQKSVRPPRSVFWHALLVIGVRADQASVERKRPQGRGILKTRLVSRLGVGIHFVLCVCLSLYVCMRCVVLLATSVLRNVQCTCASAVCMYACLCVCVHLCFHPHSLLLASVGRAKPRMRTGRRRSRKCTLLFAPSCVVCTTRRVAQIWKRQSDGRSNWRRCGCL